MCTTNIYRNPLLLNVTRQYSIICLIHRHRWKHKCIHTIVVAEISPTNRDKAWAVKINAVLVEGWRTVIVYVWQRESEPGTEMDDPGYDGCLSTLTYTPVSEWCRSGWPRWGLALSWPLRLVSSSAAAVLWAAGSAAAAPGQKLPGWSPHSRSVQTA